MGVWGTAGSFLLLLILIPYKVGRPHSVSYIFGLFSCLSACSSVIIGPNKVFTRKVSINSSRAQTFVLVLWVVVRKEAGICIKKKLIWAKNIQNSSFLCEKICA